MEHASTTPFAIERDEISLAKSAVVGVIAGMVVWGVLGVVAVRLGWPEESWGFAATVGAFAGLWGGPFFGSAAGIAAHQLKVEAREKAEAASHTTTVTTSVASVATAAVPTV